MTETHTPGLLAYKQALHPSDGAYDFAISAEIEGKQQCIAEVFGRCSETALLPSEANARRIVACWNACQSIPTAALEAGVVKEIVQKYLPVAVHALRSYQYGNGHPELAEVTANKIDALLTSLTDTEEG